MTTHTRRDVDGADFAHADGEKGHEANAGVVGFDEDDGAGRDGGGVGLGFAGGDGVRRRRRLLLTVRFVVVVVVGVGETVEIVGGIVSSRDAESFDDGAADGTVPAVVAEGAEVGLVDGPADELMGRFVAVEHVVERVRLTFEPKGGGFVDIVAPAEEDRTGFAGVVNEGGVFFAKGLFGEKVSYAFLVERPNAFAELPGEEVVPGSKAIVWGGRIADVELFKGIVGRAVVAFRRYSRDGIFAQPAIWSIGENADGVWRTHVLSPPAEDFGPLFIHVFTEEESVA